MPEKIKSRTRGDAQTREKQAQLSRAIGGRLKVLYGQTMREDVPQRFVELLARLDETERTPDGGEKPN